MARNGVFMRFLSILPLCVFLSLVGCIETKNIIRPESGSGESNGSSSGDDAELTPPVPVGGTYLCLIDEDGEVPDTVPGSTPGGCYMSESRDVTKSSKKIVLGPELEVQMKIMTAYNEVITGAEVREAPPSSRFNWYVYIPSEQLDGARSQIRIIHKETQQERKEFSRFIRLSEPSISIDRPTVVIGKDFDLHVGDTVDVSGSPEAQINKKCTPEDRGNQPLKVSGHRISIDFEVPDRDTLVGLTFEDICDSGSPLNTVSVKGPNEQYAALDQIGMESSSLLLESLKHPADAVGPIRYTLTIESAYSDKTADYDDFIVGKITFTSSKAIQVFEDSLAGTQKAPSSTGVYERTSVKASVFGAPTGSTKQTFFQALVSGDKITQYKYKVVPASGACSSMADYSNAVEVNVPIAIDMKNFLDGTYRLCVLGHDDENYWQPLTSATTTQWRRDTVADAPTLGNAPVGVSPVVDLNISVVGEDTRFYKYKVGAAGSTDCAVEAGYSDWRSSLTNIRATIASIPDGVIRLCVVSRDALENVLPFGRAKSATWTKNTAPPEEK